MLTSDKQFILGHRTSDNHDWNFSSIFFHLYGLFSIFTKKNYRYSFFFQLFSTPMQIIVKNVTRYRILFGSFTINRTVLLSTQSHKIFYFLRSKVGCIRKIDAFVFFGKWPHVYTCTAHNSMRRYIHRFCHLQNFVDGVFCRPCAECQLLTLLRHCLVAI